MSISLFGFFWIIILSLTCILKDKYLLYVLLLSFVFQSAWVVLIFGIDLNASLITSVFFIAKGVICKRGKILFPTWALYGLTFVFLTIAISIISPNLFSGMHLNTVTNSGFNFHRLETVVVSFSFSNLTLGFSLLLYLLDAVIVYNLDFKVSIRDIERVYTNIFIFVILVGLLHVLLMFIIGNASFLRIIFHNEYMLYGRTYFDNFYIDELRFSRLMSTFDEPSYCGAYLATSFFYFYYSNLKYRKFYVTLSLIGLLLNMSSTGIVTISIYTLLLLICHMSRKGISKEFIIILFIVIIFIILLVVNEEFRITLYNITFGKVNSGSYKLRNLVNNYSLEAFYKSYGLGMGGNSITSYSLIYSLLSQVGILGLISYSLLIKSLLCQLKKDIFYEKNIKIQYLVMLPLISSLLSCQALNFCVMWMGICLYILYLSIYKKERNV
ncbi:hypothetical protein [Streptococcus equinus]|uniref:hypothetical protein n=1 Tax=Streptococcus equinus TaxID=1335 RepID=UPI003BF8C796